MWENLTDAHNLPFAIALGMLLLIFVMSLLSFIGGMDGFGFLDGILPDFDSGLDTNLDAASLGPFQAALSFLNLGKVPVVFSLLLFLFLFSCIGYNMQLALSETGAGRLPWWIASPIALAFTLPLLRWGNSGMAKVLPKDETSVISQRDLIGRIGVITIGTATNARPAEVRVKDHLERDHYIQVVADEPGVEFPQGREVLLVGRRGYLFTAIANTNPNLTNYLHQGDHSH